MSHRQSYKEEPGVPGPNEHHLPQHSQHGGPQPPQLHQSRPPSIVHNQHHLPPQSHNQHPYAPSHSVPQYSQGPPGAGHGPSELPYYTTQQSHPSPYSTPSASGTYSSAAEGTPDIMATAQMARGTYPPIYGTPQSNSPASVASPSGHDSQHGRMYGQPIAQHTSQQMYYPPPQQQQYQPMPPQSAPSYAHPQQQQHQQQQHHQQSMTSQPSNLLMSQTPAQHQMQQQHPSQHAQPGMTSSPRAKMEPHVPQISRPAAPLGPPQQQQQPQQHPANGPPMNQNNVPGTGGSGVNPNAAPGPIPATTPLVVRQDNNGVQWIAFEYSRDRVKMEYTIRCDVESVTVDTLSPEFKTENCVYPRACCSKDQYRGNRLVYENECNTVGWALAELNPCLRGKRGLIQRAVDSWRNSNQDPRLRSRRVRRMAKINNRKAVQSTAHPPHMAGPSGPAGMPPSGNMGPGGASNMGKPSLGGMGGPQLHHHHNHPDGSTGGDDVDNDEYSGEDQNTHHHQAPGATASNPQDDSRDAHVFQGYSSSVYPPPPSGNLNCPSQTPPMHSSHGGAPHPSSSHPISARSTHPHSSSGSGSAPMSEADRLTERLKLFGDIPESKKRKFILVDDPGKGGQRIRVRVTLDTVDVAEIPDSFRKANAVYPRSYFPIQMQSPPPSARGSQFFLEDDDDEGDEVDGGRGGGTVRGRDSREVPLPASASSSKDPKPGLVDVPRMRKSVRTKEKDLNNLGFRMTWHQSRVFADKTVFLQKALDSYRNKVRTTMENTGKDVAATAPHFETRVGKRTWNERGKRDRERRSEE